MYYDKQESSERHSFCVSFQSSLLLPETGVDFRFNLSGGDFFFCFPFLWNAMKLSDCSVMFLLPL